MLLKLFLMLTLLAIASQANIITNNQDSIFSKVKVTKTVISKEIINRVNYTPPMMVIGNSDGSITCCPVATPKACEVYHSGDNDNSIVTATVVHGEFLYASLNTGIILRCLWQKINSCYEFNRAGIEITSLVVAAGFIHAGLQNGTILRCQLDTPGNCWKFADFRREITTLDAYGSFIYAGSKQASFLRCPLNSELNCSYIHEDTILGSFFNGIIQGEVFYELVFADFLQTSIRYVYGFRSHDNTDRKTMGYKSMAFYKQIYYWVLKGEGIYVNKQTSKGIQLFLRNQNAVSVSFAYGTFAMQEKYRLESQKCMWQGVFTSPRTVWYYDVGSRSQWEVTVKDGWLYDSQGFLLDTSDADSSYSQKAAIFVMGPDGQILVSKFHKKGHTHTSSLMAGNPVSSAGLMVVERGKIRNITACSLHYSPDVDLNHQIKESLELKGYYDYFDSYPCTYEAVLCDMDDTNVS